MSVSANHQRDTVYYTGHVQGVGFRYATRSIAENYAVTGYVRNMPDGRVELVVEGEGPQRESFQAEVRNYFTGRIRDEKRDTQPATGEFVSFEIRH
jgi:acylphosphatase